LLGFSSGMCPVVGLIVADMEHHRDLPQPIGLQIRTRYEVSTYDRWKLKSS
jgi:hypothetical protein